MLEVKLLRVTLLIEPGCSNLFLREKKNARIFRYEHLSLGGEGGIFESPVKKRCFLLSTPARGLAEWLDNAAPVRIPRN